MCRYSAQACLILCIGSTAFAAGDKKVRKKSAYDPSKFLQKNVTAESAELAAREKPSLPNKESNVICTPERAKPASEQATGVPDGKALATSVVKAATRNCRFGSAQEGPNTRLRLGVEERTQDPNTGFNSDLNSLSKYDPILKVESRF